MKKDCICDNCKKEANILVGLNDKYLCLECCKKVMEAVSNKDCESPQAAKGATGGRDKEK